MFIIVVALLLLAAFTKVQSECNIMQVKVEVEGKLLCRKQPASQILVTLLDVANGQDEILSWTTTNMRGEFHRLYGQKLNTTRFKPYVKITHKCNDEYADGFRVIKFEIPKSFIGRTTCDSYHVAKPHDIGEIELAYFYSVNFSMHFTTQFNLIVMLL
ncbi:unnamed protein product [Enterobius vermicularis]|uniref:Transthyretin-like family protein n=1 Tax=Enterobius vermicularis TaxID=51028 RepID=A0A0N4VRT5_ENTVE|nr:unnamed protein product [Enterobius vermicularis]